MANISDEELYDEFDVYGVEFVGNPDITDKLKELCAIHRIDAERIASEWAAYSHTRGEVVLTLEHLESLDRQMSNKKGSKSSKTPARKSTKTTRQVYSTDELMEEVMSTDAVDELLDAYGTPQNKQKGQKRQITPEMLNRKRITDTSRTAATPFSPSSLSPAVSTPSAKYNSRSNSGEVIGSHGNTKNVNWTSTTRDSCSVSVYDSSMVPEKDMKYMYQKIADKVQVLDDIIVDMSDHLKDKHNIEAYAPVHLPTQADTTIVGRICCDSEGKLNAKSILIEGCRETSHGTQIPLDVSSVSNYSLFPGQVIAVNGVNTNGQKFVTKTIFEGVPASLPENVEFSAEPLNILVACGPFTTSDTLSYEPLEDLKKCIRTQRPNVCILLGPFVDIANEQIEKGHIDKSFEDIFKEFLHSIIEETKRFSSEILVIPSQRDVHHAYVYPQPPFAFDMKEKRVHLMMDPCTVNIEGVVFGITSTDTLFQLGSEEISNHAPGSSDRMARLVRHLLAQRSYYPLYPPCLDVNVDYELYEKYGRMPVTPHVLITPSDLRQFVKEVDKCTCINPGRLAKGKTGGSYARMHITTKKVQEVSDVPQVTVEVVRI